MQHCQCLTVMLQVIIIHGQISPWLIIRLLASLPHMSLETKVDDRAASIQVTLGYHVGFSSLRNQDTLPIVAPLNSSRFWVGTGPKH